MSDTRFAETRIRQANPRPAGASGPDVEWSPAELLSQIEHRSETMEIVEATETQPPNQRPKRRRPALVAATALAVVLIVGAAVFAFANNRNGTDVVEPTPTTLTAPTTVPTPTTQPPVTTVPATTAVATTIAAP